MPRVLIRRFLLLQLLMIWQGGFLFYALVVVPVGASVLGSAAEQAKVTRHATAALNAIGLLCLIALLVDAVMYRHCVKPRLILTAIALLCLGTLVPLHRKLVALMDSSGDLYHWHAAYLTISGLQWIIMLAAAWYTLAAWRAEDLKLNPSGKT